MLGIGSEELLIIIIFSILVFDPDKLPEAGRRLGRAFRYMKKTKQDVQEVVEKEVIRPLEAADESLMSDMRKIEKKVNVGSFDALFDESERTAAPKDVHAGEISEQTDREQSDSQSPSIQEMCDLLYGIEDGKGDEKNS